MTNPPKYLGIHHKVLTDEERAAINQYNNNHGMFKSPTQNMGAFGNYQLSEDQALIYRLREERNKYKRICEKFNLLTDEHHDNDEQQS